MVPGRVVGGSSISNSGVGQIAMRRRYLLMVLWQPLTTAAYRSRQGAGQTAKTRSYVTGSTPTHNTPTRSWYVLFLQRATAARRGRKEEHVKTFGGILSTTETGFRGLGNSPFTYSRLLKIAAEILAAHFPKRGNGILQPDHDRQGLAQRGNARLPCLAPGFGGSQTRRYRCRSQHQLSWATASSSDGD